MATVVHVISSFDVFGPEKTVINESRALLEAGWQCSVVNLHGMAETPFEEKVRKAGIPCHHIECRSGMDTNAVRKLRELLVREHCDLVHSHGYKSDVTTLLAVRSTDMARVTTVHGWTTESWKVRLYEAAQALSWRWFDRVFCVSDFYQRVAREKGVPRDKLFLLYNGIKQRLAYINEDGAAFREHWGIAKDDVTVGIVGRLSVEKGHNVFLEVATRIGKTEPGVKFVIVGDGILRSELEAQATALGITENVIFAGHQDDMTPVYQALDVLAICSSREGLPNVLLEAMLYGMPVVSMDVGGIAEVIGGEQGGVLVSPGDVDQFTARLGEIVRDAERRTELGEKGKQRVASAFNFDRRMETVMDEYLSLTARRKGVVKPGFEGR